MNKKFVDKMVHLALLNNCDLILSVSGTNYYGHPLKKETIEKRQLESFLNEIEPLEENLVLTNVRRQFTPLAFDHYELKIFEYAKIDTITLSLYELDVD